MSNKKRSFEPKALQDVLNQLTSQPKIASGLNQVKVKEAWKATMGEHVASYTQEIKLRGKSLYITLSSSALKEELGYGKEKILKHLNETLGFEAVETLIYR